MKKKRIIIIAVFICALPYILFALFLLFLFLFPDKKIYHYELNQEKGEIVNIYIVDAQNEIEFEIIEFINLDRKDEFLNDVLEINYKKVFGMDPGHPSGLCFVIEYDCGNYEIISERYPRDCIIENGNPRSYRHTWYRCDSDDFNLLISKYLYNQKKW